MRFPTLLAGIALAACLIAAPAAEAGHPNRPVRQGIFGSAGWPPRVPTATWHGSYYDPAWGLPHTLVVPPTARLQTNWGWGVANTRVSRIPYQFTRPWPGPFSGNGGFRPVPPWPSDTTQFGVYYVRGPW